MTRTQSPVRPKATADTFWNLPPVAGCANVRPSRLARALGVVNESDEYRPPCKYMLEMKFDKDHHVTNLHDHNSAKSRLKRAVNANTAVLTMKKAAAANAASRAEQRAKAQRSPRPFEDPLLRLQRKMVNENKEHYMLLHTRLLELWKSRVLCDVMVKVADIVMPIHSCLLTAHTNFWSKYCSDHCISDPPTSTVELDFRNRVTVIGVRFVVNYLYTGKIKVRHDNCVEIFDVARTLQMPSLTRSCENFIKVLLQNHNLWNVVAVGRVAPSALFDIGWTKLATRFVRLSKSPEFAEVALDDLSEMQVFEAALFWINSQREERVEHFKDVMACPRFAFMTTDELVQCMQADPLFQQDIGMQFLCSANLAKMFASENETWSAYNLINARRPEMVANLTAATGPDVLFKTKNDKAIAAIDAQVSTTGINLAALLDAKYHEDCCKDPCGYRCPQPPSHRTQAGHD